jgi:hypothetical protein
MSESDTYRDVCIPVELSGDVYVVSRDWLRSGLEYPERRRLEALIGKTYSTARGRVVEGTQSFDATIYVPEGEVLGFAVLDDTLPVLGSILHEFDSLELNVYLNSLMDRCLHTEYILPKQRSHLETDFVLPNLRCPDEGDREMGWEELQTSPRMLVVGAAGSGKTTLLRRLMLIELKRFNPGESALPVYVSLRRWDPEQSLTTYIQREIAELNGAKFAVNFNELAILGRVSVALDGFDEIPSEARPRAREGLRVFFDSYPKCRAIMTVRWGVEPDVSYFQRVEVRPMDFSQIRELTYHKLWSEKSWESFVGQLAAEPDVLQLARNPLILTLLIARFARNEVKPSFLNEVLDLTAQALMDEWDALRGIVRWQSGGLSSYRKAAYLRVIATHLAENEQQSFTVEEIAESLGRVSQDVSAGVLVDRLQESTGLICKLDENRWAFTHRIFYEYFSTMHWMARLKTAVQSIIEQLLQHPDWDVIQRYRLLGGLASDTTDLFSETFGARPEHSLGIARALTEAMTQRLTVDPQVLVSYGSYIRDTLERYLSNVRAPAEGPPASSGSFLRLEFGQIRARGETDLLAQLFEAMHRVRGGSGAESLAAALSESPMIIVRNLAEFIRAEGTFTTNVEEDAGRITLNLAIYPVSGTEKATAH